MALKNYVVDEDLKAFYPTISDGIWKTQSDYSTQIEKSYDRLINDLYNANIEPRLAMPHRDLKLAHTATVFTNPPTSTIETTSTTGSAYENKNYRRMVLNITAISGSNTVKLQGSNDSEASDYTNVSAASWQDVPDASITVDSTDEVGEHTVKFKKQYKWYRYVSTIGGSMNYSVELVDTLWDDVICYGALMLVFRDWVKEVNDIWDIRSQQAERDYYATIKSLKYQYDHAGTNDPAGVTDVEPHYVFSLFR